MDAKKNEHLLCLGVWALNNNTNVRTNILKILKSIAKHYVETSI